jgi:hypothetical protein
MKPTPENEAKKAVMEVIDRVVAEIGGKPAYIEHRGASAFGAPGVDIHMLWHGRYFAIEVKRFDGKGKTRGRQSDTMERVVAAGGVAMVIDSHGMLTLFEHVLRGNEAPPALNPTPQVQGLTAAVTQQQQQQALANQKIAAVRQQSIQFQQYAIDRMMAANVASLVNPPVVAPQRPMTEQEFRDRLKITSNPEAEGSLFDRFFKGPWS